MKSDEFISKAQENIYRDREKLQRLYDDLERLKDADPVAVQIISSDLVKIADSLTKQTAQLVELAKLKQKAEGVRQTEDELSSEDYEELYNAIDGREAIKNGDWDGDA